MALRRTIGRTLGALALLALAAAGPACASAPTADRAVAAQADAGPPGPTLPGSDTLAAAAAERVEALCAAGSVRPDPSAYRQETWAEVAERAGRAPLPPSPEDADRAAALAVVEAGWPDEAAPDEAGWDRRETASTDCPDGYLYAVEVLARVPEPADAGPYRRRRHPAGAIVHTEALRYGTARDVAGRPVDLLLDLFVPSPEDEAPTAGASEALPTLVLVHGGGFAGGSRTQHADDALAWARRGFVVATIDYRLDPGAGDSPADHRAAGFAAIDDGMEAVRWLRAHADEHRIDPDRIAALGASAGGSVALGLALLEDLTPGGPHGDLPSQVAAAFSTGVFLAPVQGAVGLDARDAPVLLHHFETDTESGRPWTYAARTCAAVRAAGNTCDLAVSKGTDHIVGLGPDSTQADRILAFLAVHLRLDE